MLVLTRKTEQSINIGDTIRIKVLEIGNGFVKLGIDAPRNMPIYREELYEKLKQLNLESAKIELDTLHSFINVQKKPLEEK